MVSSLINFTITSTPQGINWVEGITAISTLVMTIATIVMAIIAWKALNSWKKELKTQKKVSVLTDIYNIFYTFESFLNTFLRGLPPLNHGKIFANKPINIYLNETNEKINTLIIEAQIIKHKDLILHLKFLQENIKEYFPVKQTDDDGNDIYSFETFISRYYHNKNFKEKLKDNLKKIQEICQNELTKIYS